MLIAFTRSLLTVLGIIALSCMAGMGAACGWTITQYLLCDKTNQTLEEKEVEAKC